MRLDLPGEINRIRWLERLGVQNGATSELKQQLAQAEKKLMVAALPQGIYRQMAVSEAELSGDSIKRHLSECEVMIVMAVTLGAGVDRLIRTTQVRDMAEAVLLDTGASVLVDQIADMYESSICSTLKVYSTGRFSPGYGDFPIEMQDRLTKLLDTHRQIGLSANENNILIPRKSITAIAGIASHPVRGYPATCSECILRENCGLRKKGKNCAGL